MNAPELDQVRWSSAAGLASDDNDQQADLTWALIVVLFAIKTLAGAEAAAAAEDATAPPMDATDVVRVYVSASGSATLHGPVGQSVTPAAIRHLVAERTAHAPPISIEIHAAADATTDCIHPYLAAAHGSRVQNTLLFVWNSGNRRSSK